MWLSSLAIAASCECVCTDGVEVTIAVAVPEPEVCDTDAPTDTGLPVDTAPPPLAAVPAHVILWVPDDMGAHVPGYAGGPSGVSPTLDSLAAAGVVLERAYAAPTCSPTRHALLTGRQPYRDQVDAPGDSTRWPALSRGLAARFAAAGWETAAFGKWHLDGLRAWPDHGVPVLDLTGEHSPTAAGFGRWEVASSAMTVRDADWMLGRQDGAVMEYAYEDEQAMILVSLALAHIDAATGPTLTVLTPTQTHNPYTQGSAADLAVFSALDDVSQRHYAEALSLDRALAALVAGLDSRDLLADTLLVVYGDNGGLDDEAAYSSATISPRPNGALRDEKHTVYEGGIRVPSVWHWPAGLPARVSTDLVHAVDVPHTLGALAGVPMGALLQPTDGEDRSGALLGASQRSAGLYARGNPAVTTAQSWIGANGRWKLVRPASGSDVLYDLQTDPGETTAIGSGHGAYALRQAELDAWLSSAASSRAGADYGSEPDSRRSGVDWWTVEPYATEAATLCLHESLASSAGCP